MASDFATFQDVASKAITHPDLQSTLAEAPSQSDDVALKKLFVDRGILPAEHTTVTKIGGVDAPEGIRFCVTFNEDDPHPTQHCLTLSIKSAS